MRPSSLTAAFVWLLAIVGPAARGAPEERTGANGAGPIVTSTRQNAFTIPFRIEPPQNPSQQPVEVQLHTSTDLGRSWELTTRVKPEKGAFVFRAPHDGEYWYSIRTVDNQGVTRPEGPLEPQLQVTVDTVAPRLDLNAYRGEAGEIIARWQAVDPHLKPASFKLEYQINSAGPWERVAVESPPEAMRHTLSGETTWWPKNANDSILVRAEVADMAGNPAVNQAIVKPGPASSAEVARAAAPDFGRPPAAPPDSNANGAAAAGGATRWPADRSSSDPLVRSPLSDARGDHANGDPDLRNRGLGQADRGGRVPAQPVGRSGRAGRSHVDFSMLPTGERPRMVNSRSFELEYEIDSVGSSGIGKVELWGTRDGGRSWTLFGVDPDNRSPMPVNIDVEGIYGFRIVVQSGSGLGGRPPAPGDAPDIWIGVDLTRPFARITLVDVDTETNELVIRWESSDDVPSPRPISLSFSATAGGPWTPIAAGLENTLSYRWRLDSRVPDPIYLRLEARDEAGNVGIYEMPEPTSLDRHRPEGRIRSVRPPSRSDVDNQVR